MLVQGELWDAQEAAALRGTAEGGKRQSLAEDRAEAAEAPCPHATQQHAEDLLRSRSSLKQEGNGEAFLHAEYEMCVPEHLSRVSVCAAAGERRGFQQKAVLWLPDRLP